MAVAASVWWVSGAALMQALRQCDLPLLGIAVTLQIASAAVTGLRWRAALAAVGVEPLPRARAAVILSLRAQSAILLAPAGLGADVLRGYEGGFGRGAVRGLARVALLERLAGATVLGLISGAATLPLVKLSSRQWVLALLPGVLGLAMMIVASTRLSTDRARLGPVLGWTFVSHSLALAGFATGLYAVGLAAPPAIRFCLAAMGSLAGMLPISINGYGVRELVLAVLAPHLGLDGRAVVAAALVASTVLLAGLLIAALAGRFIAIGDPELKENRASS